MFFCGPASLQAQAAPAHPKVTIFVVDENGLPVVDAQVTVTLPGQPPLLLHTDYLGRAEFTLAQLEPYRILVEASDFYQTTLDQADPELGSVTLVLAHQQIVRQQVDVKASTPGIDPQQTSDKNTLDTAAIVNIPYPTSRDIRNLLPFNPGVIQDGTGQVHLAGSETYATLDLLDGFDIRSPESGNLALRVSTDAVRSMEVETTRYPVEFGKATGGVVALYTGMGDNRFRFNATDFIPSYRDISGLGLRFDKFVPRVTFSGPLARNKAWFLDGLELEYDNIVIPELPNNADSDELWRGSNLAKAQVNLTPSNILIGSLLFNDYHSPYDGISSLTPQQSTTQTDIIAWLPSLRNQHSFSNGALLDLGVDILPIRDGYEPHGNSAFAITPELSQGSYFENLTGRSRRAEGTAALYLPPWRAAGRHDLKFGIDADQVTYGERVTNAPISYLREDGTLLRLSSFPSQSPFQLNNFEIGAYAQDRWTPRKQWIVESGLRFDWDEFIRRPLYSPRLAATYSPGTNSRLKLSAGIGLYYEHTQLAYPIESFAGIRYDTYYAADGVTPISPPLETNFVANRSSLTEARALNWSLGAETKLPGSLYATWGYLQKRGSGEFVYANQSAPQTLSGTYLLTNGRQENYHSVDLSVKRSFPGGYVVFLSYTHSAAETNAALDYTPTLTVLGPQQPGPLPWDVPNRTVGWGWLPVPKLKQWDLVYTADWRTGFPYTSIDANQQVVGAPGSRRFPDFLSLSPGLEWKFHFRGSYYGLRGIMENATNRQNPAVVNNDVDSPDYGMFTEPLGRAFTARLRLISSK